MKINVGDYIRTRGGKIAKFIKYDEESENELVTDYYKYSTIWDGNVIKVSSNIIDLIEVGDYVNGEKVSDVLDDGVLTEAITSAGIDGRIIYYNDISDIVTKEQFESMQYVVKED